MTAQDPTTFLKSIVNTLSHGTTRLFRNNQAKAWVGKIVRQDNATITLSHYRMLHAGLHEGAGDLIGWQSVTVTPEMVGTTIAVVVSIEGKLGSGRASTAQRIWRDIINQMGGRAGVASTIEEARSITEGVKKT